MTWCAHPARTGEGRNPFALFLVNGFPGQGGASINTWVFGTFSQALFVDDLVFDYPRKLSGNMLPERAREISSDMSVPMIWKKLPGICSTPTEAHLQWPPKKPMLGDSMT